VHVEWPDMRAVCKRRFEEIFINKWETMSARTPRATFCRKFLPELELFLDPDAIARAIGAEGEERNIPLLVLTSLLKSEMGQKIYSGEARQAKWHSFLVDTKIRLADVIRADSDQEAYDSFTAASKAGARDLLNSGFQAHGAYEFDVECFGQGRKMSVTPLSEVPAVMCEVLLRQVVVNAGQVQPMPWEKHIADASGGHVPNLPTGVRAQTSLISDFVGGRQ
ncbi:unnamed protein product, partial [Prorocentrum cordatum]